MHIKLGIIKLLDVKGQALVDYGLIISLIILVAISGLIAVAGGVGELYEIIKVEFLNI